MTMMTASQMEDHIASSTWKYVNQKFQGSQDYNSHIGVLRIMFGITEDPNQVVTLLSDKSTEVWARYDADWHRLFSC